MATSKEQDITKTGPIGLRGIRNTDLYNTLSSLSASGDDRATSILSTLSRGKSTPFSGSIDNSMYFIPREIENSPYAKLGESTYDEPYLLGGTPEDINEHRAFEQSWLTQIGAGLAKGVVLAGTTFLDGTLGLLVGGITAITEGRWSGLWDNDFSRAMKSVNDWSEEALPNYYTAEEQDSPWYTNILSGNFIGDKFIKNLGFSIGTLYSGGIYSKGIRGLAKLIGAVAKSTKASAMINTAVGATMSAVNEGRIEALNNSTDWYNDQKAQLDDYYRGILAGIQDEYDATRGQSLIANPDGTTLTDPAYEKYNSALADADKKYKEALTKLNEDRAKMGNADLLMNLPILMASNIAQFAKFYSNGFKTARKSNKIIGRAGEYEPEKTAWGGRWAVTKGALSEGTEEISQGAASRISGDYYQDDVQNFYKSRFDPDAEQETVSWMKSFAQGINETVNDGSAWEEFFIGTLTGALGIPTFKKKANGKLGFGIEGGALNEYREYKEQMAREQEIADRINERVHSPEFLNYYQGLIRHNKYQGMMNDAADRGDEFEYKNAEHAQFVSDIAMFDNAGKLGDLKTLINEAFDTSDENLDSIIRNTTSVQGDQLIGPYAQYAQLDEQGRIISNFGTEQDKQDMIKKLTKSRDEMLNSIDDYVKIKDDIDINTKGILSDSQLEELTWMRSQINDWSKRAEDVSNDVKGAIGNIIGAISSARDFNAMIRDLEDQFPTIGADGKVDAGLSDTYKKADENVRKLDKAMENLDLLRKTDSTNLALTLSNSDNKEFTDGLIKQIRELPEEVMGTESKDDIISKLNDVIKLGEAIGQYSTKLKEYTANPEAQVRDQAKAKEQVAKQTQKKAGNAIAQRFDWDKSLGEIADTLDKNMEEIEANGGLDAFMKTLTPEQRKKLQKAKNLKKGINGLRGLVDESSLSDMQKRIADSLIEEAGRNADSIEALGNSLTEALNNGVVAERVTKALERKERAGLNDLAIEEAIQDTEAKLREFLDDNLVKAASALEEAEKMSNAKTDKELSEEAAEQASKLKDTPPLDPKEPKEPKALKGSEPQEPKEPKGPTGLDEPKEPKGLGDKPLTPSEKVRKSNQSTNQKATKPAGPIQKGAGAQKYGARPQLSQTYLHGYDMQTYPQYIEEHPEAIPEGVDKEAYKKYVQATHDYLKENGAFQYISNGLQAGDEIEFVVDEDLNEKAGTPVVLMKSNGHIIGSLPTAVEMDSRTKYTETVNGKLVQKTSNKTLAQKNPGVKALYDKVVSDYEEWKKNKTSQNIPERYTTGTYKERFNNLVNDGIIEEGWTNVNGREVLLVNINGVKVPFYKSSSGTDGKTKGNWYPFFGVGAGSKSADGTTADGNWLIKGGITEMENGYGIPEIQRVQNILNRAFTWEPGEQHHSADHTIFGKGSPNSINEKVLGKKDSGVQNGVNAEAHIKEFLNRITSGRTSFSGGKTKVASLMGGVLPLSNIESTVAEVFEGTGQTPVIAVADENGSPSRFKGKELDSPLMDPETAVQGQVYVMIPTSTGSMLPALTYSTPLSQLGQNDWYIKQIMDAVKAMPQHLRDLSSASHDLYKLLHIPGLSVQIGKQSKKSWTNTNDLTEATHLRLSYSDPKNPENPRATVIPITNGEMTDEDVWSAISGMIKAYPETTTSVDITRLGDSEEDQEYRRNIANYLSTNLVRGQAHSVNDWFTYEPTSEQKSATASNELKELKELAPRGKDAKTTPDTDPVTPSEPIEVQKLETLDLSQDDKPEDLGGLALFARGDTKEQGTFSVRVKPSSKLLKPRRGGKKLEVTRTEDSSAKRSQIAGDIMALRRMFPELSQAHTIVLVRGLINTVNEKGDPIKAYGEFRDGVIYISDQSPAGTAFHEAFHYITDTLMSQREKDAMFRAAKERYGDLSQMELEERLAEDFRNFMNGYQGNLGILKSLYQRLKQIIKAITGRTNYLDNLFYSIYNGTIAERGTKADNDTFRRDLTRYRDRKLSYDNLDRSTREYLDQKKVSKADYDRLSTDAKEDTLQCIL